MHFEFSRIDELRRYDILDTPPDGSFNDLCAIAARVFNAPVALVTLVDTDRVWFAASHGIGQLRQVDRGPGLCASAILQDGPYVAPDLQLDPNSLANPLVARENGFRFYAAVPLKSSRNFNLGTMCILDHEPREFTEADQQMLERFARMVMQMMEHRLASRSVAQLAQEIEERRVELAHRASHDSLTDLLNRTAMERHLARAAQRSHAPTHAAYALLDVDHFKSINDTYGHPVGDIVLQQVARRLASAVRAEDKIARIGGEEFAFSLWNVPLDQAIRTVERARHAVSAEPITFEGGSLTATVSGGICMATTHTPKEVLLRAADDALYYAKRNGRNRVAYCTVSDGENGLIASEPQPVSLQ